MLTINLPEKDEEEDFSILLYISPPKPRANPLALPTGVYENPLRAAHLNLKREGERHG